MIRPGDYELIGRENDNFRRIKLTDSIESMLEQLSIQKNKKKIKIFMDELGAYVVEDLFDLDDADEVQLRSLIPKDDDEVEEQERDAAKGEIEILLAYVKYLKVVNAAAGAEALVDQGAGRLAIAPTYHRKRV